MLLKVGAPVNAEFDLYFKYSGGELLHMGGGKRAPRQVEVMLHQGARGGPRIGHAVVVEGEFTPEGAPYSPKRGRVAAIHKLLQQLEVDRESRAAFWAAVWATHLRKPKSKPAPLAHEVRQHLDPRALLGMGVG